MSMSIHFWNHSFIQRTALLICLLSLCCVHCSAYGGLLRITEAMSASDGGSGGTQDWFELTNYGTTSINISGWSMADASSSYNTSVALNGVTTIAVNESVVFLEVQTLASTEIAAFRSFWGGSATTAKIGWYSGNALQRSGDGIVIKDTGGAEQTPRTAFGQATNGQSFYWAYTATGDFYLGSGTNGLLSTVGTIAGVSGGISQTTFSSTSPPPSPFTVTNLGSPGTAAVVPEPSTYAMALAGLFCGGVSMWRRRKWA
jgi:hypothetical protein